MPFDSSTTLGARLSQAFNVQAHDSADITNFLGFKVYVAFYFSPEIAGDMPLAQGLISSAVSAAEMNNATVIPLKTSA